MWFFWCLLLELLQTLRHYTNHHPLLLLPSFSPQVYHPFIFVIHFLVILIFTVCFPAVWFILLQGSLYVYFCVLFISISAATSSYSTLSFSSGIMYPLLHLGLLPYRCCHKDSPSGTCGVYSLRISVKYNNLLVKLLGRISITYMVV